ncbi:integrase, catalytic region, zinc finger, CCHC-type containing protein [Tanacetum coccineum]
MTTLTNKAILSGADNRPPMLEKNMYDSWKSIMELYMLNRQHGRMILECRMILASVEKGPLVWPSITEDGLPIEIYALVSQHRVAKDLWEKIKLLMQGTSLTKQERECKLYDEFDKFTYKKGESLHEYYLRFTLLLNDMNIYKMPLEQFQVNTKFLNTLPDEWSKFVTDVKLVKHLQYTNVELVHAYWKQHEDIQMEVGRHTSFVAGIQGLYTPESKWKQFWKNTEDGYLLQSAMGKMLFGVHNHRYMDNNAVNQAVQVMSSSQQSNVVNHSETEITSDSNIITYSQYLNLENKSVNDTLTAELERYKEQVKVLKEGQNVDLKRTVHSAYIKHSQEDAAVLRDLAGSQPQAQYKKDKCPAKPSSTLKNKVEDHHRTVKSSLKNKDCVVAPKGTANVQHSKLNANSELKCVKCNGCMLSDNHDLCVLVVQIVLWYLDSGCSKHMTEDRSQLTNFVSKFLGTVEFDNDHVTKIIGYGDYQIRNVTISRVYYVEGLGHNLFFVGQFCDSNLEVAFRQHTCYIRNLEGVDLLTGSRGDNLYILSLGDMMASSPICLLSKAFKTKSWLWHRRLFHLNFGAINHLARHGLVQDNGTGFVNQTLREYYEKVGSISHALSATPLHSKMVLLKDEIVH